jgi:uncharacterized membrane protein
MKQVLTVGLSLLAGAALMEAALVPGLVIGGAAALAPAYVPQVRRRLRPVFDFLLGQNQEAPSRRDAAAQPSLLATFKVGRAAAKTVTFRIIVTSLDFTTNYIVIGEFATAAGLSTFSTVAGPLFYFLHEALWNRLGATGAEAEFVPFVRIANGAEAPRAVPQVFAVSRPVAKTITFRTFATVMDFTTNFVVIGDAVTAAGLAAFGFILGPFVYLGHEWVWDFYSPAEGPNRETTARSDNFQTVTGELNPRLSGDGRVKPGHDQ